LTVLIYELTKEFPREEMYGLASQMRRAAVSIPSNIAEGAGRLNAAEYRQFLGIARGSSFELLTQLTISRELGLSSAEKIATAEDLCNELGRMTFALIAGMGRGDRSAAAEVSPEANGGLAIHTSHSTLST
jgi:four helix bundle protein